MPVSVNGGLIFTRYRQGSQKYEDDEKPQGNFFVASDWYKVAEKIVLNRIKTWVKAELIQGSFP